MEAGMPVTVLTGRVEYRARNACNRGGRLKDLKTRNLMQKFLYLWIQKTFGRVRPSQARSRYRQRVLQRAFEGWREEWWMARREWRLCVRADCHYRYRLYNQVFINWKQYVSTRRERKERLNKAASYGEGRRQCLAWERWLVYLQVQRIKRSMQESAQQQRENTALRSAWMLWRSRLQWRDRERVLEDRALQHWALALQSRAWLLWREGYLQACVLREGEARATLHHHHRVLRGAVLSWAGYLHYRRAKREQTVLNEHQRRYMVLRRYWCTWRDVCWHRHDQKTKWQAASAWAQRSTQLRVLHRWKGYTQQCLTQAERERCAGEQHARHLMALGLRILTLNVTQRKARRVNNNVAIQQHRHTVIARFWRLWEERSEEAEERTQQPQKETALTRRSMTLLKSAMHCWRRRLAERRIVQQMELRADRWFAESALPQCFHTWEEFVTQERKTREMRGVAETHVRQRTYTWAFCTWWARSEEQRDKRLAERMAVLHADHSTLLRAWVHWCSRVHCEREEREKHEAAVRLYLNTLLQHTLRDWRHNTVLIQSGREREQRAAGRGQRLLAQRAWMGWREYIQYRREKMRSLEKADHFYQCKLLAHTLQGWKEYHRRAQLANHIAGERQRRQHQSLLRKAMHTWQENVALLMGEKNKERRATERYQRTLLSKVLLAWKEAAACTVLSRQRQEEAVRGGQAHLQRVRLLQVFQRWRQAGREAQQERLSTEKAQRHHHTALLRTSFRAWSWQPHQHRHRRVMLAQANWLLQQRTCLQYFALWKRQLQLRRHEAELTEVALWHWSVTLQTKVIEAWRFWVWECRRKEARLARAARFHREQLLREGVARVLSYSADMGSVRANLALHSQERGARRLQSVVWRCAMRWKRRALGEPGGGTGGRHKKSVSFHLPLPVSKSGDSRGEDLTQGSADHTPDQLFLVRASRLQPRRSEHLWDSPDTEPTRKPVPSAHTQHVPSQEHRSAQVSSSLPAHLIPLPPTAPASLCPAAPGQEARSDGQHQPPNQEVLLPPSSFMVSGQHSSLLLSRPQCDSDVLLSPKRFTCPAAAPTAAVCEGGDEEEEMGNRRSVALTNELLRIQREMQRYQHEKKQLQSWHSLAEVLKAWLQTSAGEDEDKEERRTTRLELEELEARIGWLTPRLEQEKQAMQCYAARIRSIASRLQEEEEGT
ncbi:hypothetical protein AAFF_G00066660 [Aldrovandia affinis]|uniref:Protein SFI1 homolog n=1 Tax=Aldrovandia affinis TaxID=143900 RepID=A0AAD7T496_9TELE|nr:hypothetical protein AAFF_G00066660 [Aldrovandia affinis]